MFPEFASIEPEFVKNPQPGLMDLDFEPIEHDNGGNLFVTVDDGFDFDESEKDFLRELTESIPEQS